MMMEGLQFIKAVVSSGDHMTIVRNSISPDLFFAGDEDTAYHLLTDHVSKYGKLPDELTFNQANIHLPEAPEPSEFYLEKLTNRYRHQLLKQTLEDVSLQLNAQNGEAAVDLINERMKDLAGVVESRNLIDLRTQAEQLYSEYVTKVQLGYKGIPFGWEHLDEEVGGGQFAGDVNTIIGRPAQGKSQFLLYSCIQAWRKGYVPMFVSMEMTALAVVIRALAQLGKLNSTHVAEATMGTMFGGHKLKEVYSELSNSPTPFHLLDGQLATNVDVLAQQVALMKPDILYVDGAYLLGMRNKNLKKYEIVAEATRELKRIAMAFKIPVFASYQFNREGNKKNAGLEEIGYSDEIGQISAVVLGVEKDDVGEGILKKTIRVLKGREGQTGSFEVHWNFNETDFSQYPEEELQIGPAGGFL